MAMKTFAKLVSHAIIVHFYSMSSNENAQIITKSWYIITFTVKILQTVKTTQF